ncbi:hypothetical protein NLY43_04275 [Mesorhizobium sp. C416B]|uniref:hypothetical protein n=1 Tax=unclassified Mesorhizobium TaxID=325217 RepID=UPI0003CF3B7A|nr:MULTISPECIES: hypothetical protein [unclassified Mesorhizobium]ESX47730.1 hypothetical protein X762_17900 [Mesorhizobium sp. LSHC426A00]ESX51753.1 hypothetical protein X761_24355 [Mesorhizobium sp. LSHC424B00]ESX69924.1 hypothetical protein X758_19020 [Mesorhizobium sp. LSHC416B00]ESX71848.1 hypothetical protein X757_22360 [Mesorhizobium sp. LSHC414A00]WJI63992.1 hypothetical protein NLY43_04275 [Mesorhizobium sp. C416B]
MVWSDLLLFSPVILGLGGMALTKLPDLLDVIQGTPGQSDFERFMMDAGRRGLGYSDTMRELDIRTIFARLRREASGSVAADVGNWKPILDARVEQCLQDNPEHAPDLIGMMAGLSYGDILYPSEAAMVDDLYSGFRRHRGCFTIDQQAALRVTR